MDDQNLTTSFKSIFSSLLLKGALIAAIIYFSAMCINSSIILLWFKNYDKQVTNHQWALIGFLGGVYPMTAYFLLGVVRCINVLYTEIYNHFIQPQIKNVVDRCMNAYDDNISISAKISKDFSDDILFKITSMIDDTIKNFPKWAKAIIGWILNRVSPEREFLTFIKSVETMPKSVISEKITDWIDDTLSNAFDTVKPFWLQWLIPFHVMLLTGLWFI